MSMRRSILKCPVCGLGGPGVFWRLDHVGIEIGICREQGKR
jgi:hypothetical protein